jgi:hypothetical protein
LPDFEPLVPPTAEPPPLPRRAEPPVDPLIAIADRIETMRPAVAPETVIGSIMGRAAVGAVILIIVGGLYLGLDPVRVIVSAAAAGVLLVFAAELLIGLASSRRTRRARRETPEERATRRALLLRAAGLIDAPATDAAPVVTGKGKKQKKGASNPEAEPTA